MSLDFYRAHQWGPFLIKNCTQIVCQTAPPLLPRPAPKQKIRIILPPQAHTKFEMKPEPGRAGGKE